MNNQQAMIELIKATSGQANILTIPRPYIEFMGSLDGGLFLSQLIYWSDRGGQGDGWFYKTYLEWEAETTLSKYEVSKQGKILKDQGILETKIKKANGAPTVHYRFSFDEFQKSFVKFLHYGKSRNFTMESEETRQSITETTPEITSSILAENPKLEKQNPDTPIIEANSYIEKYTDVQRDGLNKLGTYTAKSANGSIETIEDLRTVTLLSYDVAQIVNLDILAVDDWELKALASQTLRLYAKPNIAALLKLYSAWWYNEYWLGKDKGQAPTLKQLGSTWGQFEASQAKTQNGSGPVLTPEQKARMAELTAQDAQQK